ncbi:MAG: hypothetical protein J5I90_01935 [Caldilineales bacterium]|nr:hypothetical protein [Caldilineales bacterium]
MSLTGNRTFVGFGFGAIQAGLFLWEAQQSGNFGRLVVAEVVPEVVAELRAAGGMYGLNIAHSDRVEKVQVGPVEIFDPAIPAERKALIAAIAQAEEISTAIPSVAFYKNDSPGSLHQVLADGLQRKTQVDGPNAVVYAAENNNHAAEILQAAVQEALADGDQDEAWAKVRFLNTVIGKMSGVKAGWDEVQGQGLAPVSQGSERAFLVEAFNHILISQIDFPSGFKRGIDVFIEKPDLLPFEEAKLYGHNAVHALAAYLGAMKNAEFIADLRHIPDVMPFLRAAFIAESGAALIRKHADVDELFTSAGYTAYADDLLERMTNPYLRDSIERVGRDPGRKLGWHDRLVGTMRVCLSQGVEPARFALGAAAALAMMNPSTLEAPHTSAELLSNLWAAAQPDPDEMTAILAEIQMALARLRAWLDGAPLEPG